MSQKWKALERRETFDTPEWERTLDSMTEEDAQQLVADGAHLPSVKRINALKDAIKSQFARRNEIIDALCCAAIAQIPTVLVGPPGTAKSALVRALCEGLGLSARGGDAARDGTKDGGGKDKDSTPGRRSRQYFEYLLTRFTTPEEVVGPWHIKDLIENRIYRRVTGGYLPEAQIAFLDEIFKASSAILNTLLTVLNERIFYNGGEALRVPLVMAFAASNELPTDDSLKALLDRFPLRIPCPRVEAQHRAELINRAWAQSYNRQFSRERATLKVHACTNDLRLLALAARVSFSGRSALETTRLGEFDRQFLRFFETFHGEVSDRTAPLLLAFARAQAMLDNDAHLEQKHLAVYRFVGCDEEHIRRFELAFSSRKDRL